MHFHADEGSQIDSYTLAAKTEIAARATDHVTSVRDLKAESEEMERRIQLEREREGEMLASTVHRYLYGTEADIDQHSRRSDIP
jgi:hypothetical protein